jgi:hypothetical protein
MDEGRKPNEKGRKENGASGEKTGIKEGAVDDEEGTESTDINGREKEVEKKLFKKYDDNGKCIDKEKSEDKEKSNNEVKEDAISEAEIDNNIEGRKEENREAKEDEAEGPVNKDVSGGCKDECVKKVTEKEIFEDVIRNKMSREIMPVADGKAHKTKVEMVKDENKVGLKNFPIEFLPSEEGSIQLETVDHTASINNQDSTCKKESYRDTEAGNEVLMASENAACCQSNNQVTVISEQGKKAIEVPKNVEHPRKETEDKTQKQLVTDEAMRSDSGDHDKDKQKEDLKVSEIMNKELKEKKVFTGAKDEKPDKDNDVTKQESKMEDDRAVNILNNTMQDMADVEGSVNVTLVSNEICNALQNETKEREELSFIDMTEEKMGMITVAQEKVSEDEAQEMSSSKEAIKSSIQTETAVGKQEDQKTYEKEKSGPDSKANNENKMKGFSDTEKRNRVKQQQKKQNGDESVLDLNCKAASFMMRGTPELSAQKSVEEVMECSQVKQTCTSQEPDVKLNEEHIAKSSKTLASEMALPQEKYHETDQSRGISDTAVTGKPICTAFQGTAIRGGKCEESIQRSEVTHSSQNQENSEVKDGNSFSTETAINGQLKQLEYTFKQTAQEKPAPLKPQTLRQQTQQKQQRRMQQNQKQQQEQNEMEQKKQQEDKTAAKQNQQQQQQQKTQNMHKKEGNEQIQQTQQPLNPKIQMNEKHEEKQWTQQNQQHSVIKEQPEICKQKVVEHLKQRQLQTNGNSQQNQQEHRTKKQLQEELKQENQQEQQSKWPRQEQRKQQEPKQRTQKSEEEKQKEQKQPDQGLLQQEQHRKQYSKESEDDSAPGCGGTQGRSCPIYFGVKSYLHQFYDSAPVKDSQLYEDYTEVSHSIACRISDRFTDKGNYFLLWRGRGREREIQKQTVKWSHFILICFIDTCTVATADNTVIPPPSVYGNLSVKLLSLEETEDGFNCQEMAGHFFFH